MRWPWFPASLAATIAVVVTILVGLLTICEKFWVIAVGAYRQLRIWSRWPTDRRVFRFLKTGNPASVYAVRDISEAIAKKPRDVEGSLLRLAEKKKARQLEDGLWCLHDFEL